MKEQDRDVLSRFDTIWARVQPEYVPPRPERQEPDDAQALRMMIEQCAASAKVLCALARREPCCAARLQALARERSSMTLQLQGAYYLLTGTRFQPGASCAVRHESAACLRCLWLSGRNQAVHARHCAEETGEPLLKALYEQLADLLDEQDEPLREILAVVLDCTKNF